VVVEGWGVVNGSSSIFFLPPVAQTKQTCTQTHTPQTESLEWRRAHGVDACLREPLAPSLVSLIRECRPSSYIGFHRDVRLMFLVSVVCVVVHCC
jgi:hypothetical protein